MNLYPALKDAIMELLASAACGAAVLRYGGFEGVDQNEVAAETSRHYNEMMAEAAAQAEHLNLNNVQYEQLVIAGACARVLKIIGANVSVGESE